LAVTTIAAICGSVGPAGCAKAAGTHSANAPYSAIACIFIVSPIELGLNRSADAADQSKAAFHVATALLPFLAEADRLW
jgi:hypothetical protein